MTDKDPVWEHGENLYPGFKCNYCLKSWKGGGATRLKQHLAGRSGEVAACTKRPPDVQQFFLRELQRTRARKKEINEERLSRIASATACVDLTQGDDEDEVLQRVLELSRHEAEFQRRAGERYEHGGGSGAAKGKGGLKGLLRRVTSQRERPSAAVNDFDLARAKSPVQTRIDTGPWTSKGKSAKEAIGKAWSKWFHATGIPGRKADDPYFISAVKQTQQWGEGVPSPIGRDIDGKYLDQNEEDIKAMFNKWRLTWPEYGVTIMCDSWTGPTRMSVINFLLYSNGRMFFHKSIDATGRSQDAKFLQKEIKAVIKEVGEENVIHIVTDNGSNYKKACKAITHEYPHIAWQPCLAHTINLMLKTIGEFDDHKAVIDSAKEIARWLYNHGKLHNMMKNAIGGNLVKWNATRFGTNYLFLESFLRKKEAFMQWMGSSELHQSKYLDSSIGKYAHSCLSSLAWWDHLKAVVDSVQPLYAFLRFADQDKKPNLSEVLMRYHLLKHAYNTLFQNDRDSYAKYMDVVDSRLHSVANETYMNAAGALHPEAHYKFGMGQGQMDAVRAAFERMTDTDTAAAALSELTRFRDKVGSFGSPLAHKMAVDKKTSAATWWQMFGNSAPTLRQLATRLVSQCISSSGCERNWSTFAFIHTKVRNRLSHKKLHKLVYVNYNLRIQNMFDGRVQRDDDDWMDRLMELSLTTEKNPMRDWMEHARSTVDPLLDEEDDDSDVPIPSHLVTDTADQQSLREHTGTSNFTEWARQNIGDTHMGKRKASTMQPPSKSKRAKGKKKVVLDVESDATTEDDRSPPYQESEDSSSKTDSDDGGDGENISTGATHISSFQPLSPFTADANEYCTQDRDHGAPNSQRVVTGPDGLRQNAYGTYRDTEDSSSSCTLPSASYEYTMPDVGTQQPTRWVYQWVEPGFYNMLYEHWRSTSHWTNQTWHEFKAGLLRTQGMALMSTEEYYAMHE